MRQITIKELAPYLPYGLNVKSQMAVWEIISLSPRTSVAGLSRRNGKKIQVESWLLEDTVFKPLLRPLSKLTEEIEINGKKRCIMSLWFSVDAADEQNYDLYGEVPEYWKTVIDSITANGIKHLDYGFIQIMLEHHFDIFGLLDDNLAIEI